MPSSIVLLSGGMDSSTLLYQLLSEGVQCRALSVNYGQRHRKELAAAEKIVKAAETRFGLNKMVEHRVADLSPIRELLAGSSQTSINVDVPEGHYAEESMKLTVVPNRNMILMSIAVGWAISTGSDSVAYAAHAGDHTIYPDCREEFVDALQAAVNLCDWKTVRLARPFISMTKTDIVRRGTELGVPFDLTWSCYKGGEEHCGKCGTCVERFEAFELASK